MADNILKGIISVTAPNLPATATAVTRSVDGMERSLSRVGKTTQTLSSSAAKASVSLKPLANSSNQATLALGNLGRVAQDAPFGFIGIANNLNPLLESFQRLKATTGTTGGALKALGSSLTGAGGLGLALSVVSSLAIVFSDKLFGTSKAAEKAKSAADELQQSINGVFSGIAKEAAEVGSFITVLKSETETRERKLSAIKELQKIQPDIFKGLKLEGDAVVGLDNAYKNYLENLKDVIAAKILQVKLEQKIEQLLKSQGATASSFVEKTISEGGALKVLADANKKSAKEIAAGQANPYDALLKNFKENKSSKEKQLQNEIEDLYKRLSTFSSKIKVPDLKGTGLNVGKVKVDKVEAEAEVIDLTFLNVNLKDGSDKGVNATLFKGIAEQAKLNEIQIPFKFKQEQGPTEFDDGFNQVLADIAANEQAVKNLASVASDILTPAFSSFFNTVANGGNAFKAFAQAAIQALVGLISKLASAAVLSLILSSVTGGGAAVGITSDKFGDIFKALSGFGGFRASGGPVSSGRSYIVGENGPEIFNPGVSGNIVPNGRINSFNGGGLSGMIGKVVFEISGNKLIGVLANGNRSQTRLV